MGFGSIRGLDIGGIIWCFDTRPDHAFNPFPSWLVWLDVGSRQPRRFGLDHTAIEYPPRF